MVKIKRIYEETEKSDGFRILVDRLWPRGVSKEKAHIDLWLKDIGPSNELRKWFGHDPEKWEEFGKRYKEELRDKEDMIRQVRELSQKHTTITLLYAARDIEHNEAVILADILNKPS